MSENAQGVEEMTALHPSAPAAIMRRAAAYLIDCAVIIAYAGVLALVTIVFVLPATRVGVGSVQQALVGQVIGLTTLTLPVIVIFAWLESARGPGRWCATPGKRVMGLIVRRAGGAAQSSASFGQSVLRSAIKFLPWELAHTGVHHALVDDHPLPWFGIALSIAGQAAWCILAVSCTVGARRGLHDRAAGLCVANAS